MVCHCKPSSNGGLGCGEECLNRILNIECVRGTCPCGDLCSNQQVIGFSFISTVKYIYIYIDFDFIFLHAVSEKEICPIWVVSMWKERVWFETFGRCIPRTVSYWICWRGKFIVVHCLIIVLIWLCGQCSKIIQLWYYVNQFIMILCMHMIWVCVALFSCVL